MSSEKIRFELDKDQYSNLDVIKGRLFLSLSKPTPIERIVVKLEGDCHSIVVHEGQKAPVPGGGAQVPSEDGAVTRPPMEHHKLLYISHQLFPPEQVLPTTKPRPIKMAAGEYEYPFTFKIPFSNACEASRNQYASKFTSNVNKFTNKFTKALAISLPPIHHVVKSLPPSWNGIPSVAEVSYFVKATVQRAGFMKDNLRGTMHFKFVPIEPSRPPPSDTENFVRKQHTFMPDIVAMRNAAGPRESGTPSISPEPMVGIAPSFEASARLPNPAVLTHHEPLPLKVVIKKLAETGDDIYLVSLKIELIGYTEVRARENLFKGAEYYQIVNLPDLGMKIGDASDPVGTETPLATALWDQEPISDEAPPTFSTCNIKRFYGLNVRLQIGYGQNVEQAIKHSVLIPLRLAVNLYSGVPPPPQLLEMINTNNELLNWGVPSPESLDVGQDDAAPPAYEDRRGEVAAS